MIFDRELWLRVLNVTLMLFFLLGSVKLPILYVSNGTKILQATKNALNGKFMFQIEQQILTKFIKKFIKSAKIVIKCALSILMKIMGPTDHLFVTKQD